MRIERIRQDIEVDDLVRKHGLGMNVGGVLAFLDVDTPPVEREFVDGSKFGAADTAELLSSADLGLLRRKGVAVDGRLRSSADRCNEGEARQSGPLIDELVSGQVAQPEVFPPDRLVLSAVKIERVGEQPTRMLFRRPFIDVRRNAVCQAGDQRIHFFAAAR